jgi:hypothetical protein
MELDLAHLERGRMPMAHQIADQRLVLADLLGAAAIGDAGRLDHRIIVAHIVDDADKAVIEHRDRLVEDLFQRRHCGTPSRGDDLPLAGDLLLLLGGDRHGPASTAALARATLLA